MFCWLGWYEPRSTYGPMRASAPWPKRGFGAAPRCPAAASARSAASQPNAPSATMHPDAGRAAPSSRARNGAHVSRSSIVGLLAGGAQRTAAAMYASVRVRPSSARREDGRSARPGRVERRPQEVARRVAGEDPAGPIAAVGGGREPDQEDPRRPDRRSPGTGRPQ